MSKIVKLQPSSVTDQLTADGTELTQLPYPYFVAEDGSIGGQEFWKGDPSNVVGFTRRLDGRVIDLYWDQVVDSPQQVVGMYLVTRNNKGGWATHTTAIESVEEL